MHVLSVIVNRNRNSWRCVNFNIKNIFYVSELVSKRLYLHGTSTFSSYKYLTVRVISLFFCKFQRIRRHGAKKTERLESSNAVTIFTYFLLYLIWGCKLTDFFMLLSSYFGYIQSEVKSKYIFLPFKSFVVMDILYSFHSEVSTFRI